MANSKGSKKNDSAKSKASKAESKTGKAVAMAVGTAAAAVAVGAAVTKAVRGKKTVYEVKTHDKGWQVVKDGADRATSVHGTKKEAVSEARKLAASKAPCELRIYKQDGGLEDSHTYEDEDKN